jgi:predicted DNA-binding transcriptional regulator AlpA
MPKTTAGRLADDTAGVSRDTPTARHTRAARRRMSPLSPPSLLTIDQVLTELQVARSTFDTWRALGTAPECIRLPNGQLRIRRAVFDAWLADHVQAHAEAC